MNDLVNRAARRSCSGYEKRPARGRTTSSARSPPRARFLRTAHAVGRGRGARRQGGGNDADRDGAAQGADPPGAEHALAPAQPAGGRSTPPRRSPATAEGASACADRMAALLDPEEARHRAGARGALVLGKLLQAGVPRILAERVASWRRSSPRSTSRRSPIDGLRSPRSQRCTLRSARDSSCAGCETGSWRSRANRGGRRWHARRCATTSTRAGRARHEVLRAPDGWRPRASRRLVRPERGGVDRCPCVLADIRKGGAADLARLSVAVREVRNLINSTSSEQPPKRREIRRSGPVRQTRYNRASCRTTRSR